MKTDFISLRLDTKTSTTVRKLISLRLVKTKTNALKFIMKHGIMETTHIIENKEESRRIIKKWKEEGFQFYLNIYQTYRSKRENK